MSDIACGYVRARGEMQSRRIVADGGGGSAVDGIPAGQKESAAVEWRRAGYRG